jgi:thiosulfate dehydrogenase [quinone] large subunit
MEYRGNQLTSLVILRVLIGWHLLYEGIVKLLNPYWSATEYLRESQWILTTLLRWMTENALIMQIVDLINIWGLIIIGIGLIAGFATRAVCVAGILIIFLYYFANPPFIGITSPLPVEGNYLFVDKNLIELGSLLVLYMFPTGHIIGIDRYIPSLKRGDSE